MTERTPKFDEVLEHLRSSGDNDEARLEALTDLVLELDESDPETLESLATDLALAMADTPRFAERVLGQSDQVESKLRTLVFVMGVIACRRLGDRDTAERLFAGVDADFRSVPLFGHLHALHIHGGGDIADLHRAIHLEKRVYNDLQTPGAAHALAEFLLEAWETDPGAPQAERDEALREAKGRIDEALAQRPRYAKYHYTHARILRRMGRLDKAQEAIQRAIREQNRDPIDAQERLRDFHVLAALIEVDREMKQFEDESATVRNAVDQLTEDVEATEERLRGAQVQVIVAVAFVASAIGLLQVPVRVEGRPFLEAVGLTVAFGVVLFGAVAFGARALTRAGQRPTSPRRDNESA
jgi:tetratricopeptide (TPR) repeat protein